MRPESLQLSDNGDRLFIAWPGGDRDELPAPLLREKARDATSLRKSIDFGPSPAPTDLTINAVEPVGRMGVNLVFSDGHDRAIYPWAYLREIAAEKAIN